MLSEPNREPEYLDRNLLEIGPLKLYRLSYQAFIAGRELSLSVKEFEILVYLAEHQNQVLERGQFARFYSRDNTYWDPNGLTIHIKNIRCKLGAYKGCIRTVWGVGYQFVGFPEESPRIRSAT